MSDRKAVNKYYPPEWTPDKGSINKFLGTHALRERAKKLDQGILVIRFEMPYNIWCEGCENHIGMGVRYNAEKSKVGMYYTTPIYKFRMKCHLCDNYIEMQTDPANFDYIILSGASRQERRWDPTENGQIVPDDKEVGKKLVTDAMFRLEHGAEDKDKIKSLKPALAKLEHQSDRMRDDFSANQVLRQKFRNDKKVYTNQKSIDDELLRKSSLNIELLPENEDDKKMAELLRLAPSESYDEKKKKKREEIKNRPMFRNGPRPSNTISPVQETLNSLMAQALEKRLLNHTKSLSSKAIGVVRKSTKITAEKIPSKSILICDYSSSDED